LTPDTGGWQSGTMTHLASVLRRAVTPLVLLTATTAAAGPPDVKTIVGRMKQALEPPRSSVRRMTLTVTQGSATSDVQVGQVRGQAAEGNRILNVVLAPADLRGTAYLVQEAPASAANKQWAYVPAIGRVRVLVSPEAFSAFLNSDFTFADLGFTPLKSRYKLLGEQAASGGHVYRIEETPAQQWYYSRIVTTVAADSFLPGDRQFYDPANQLWKVEHFEGVSTIQGVPTVIRTTMEDVQAKSRSTIAVTDLQYDAQVPPSLLDPAALPDAAKSPVWTSLNAPVGH
jgi:outer membrane lipoprotein-sorting protein